MEKGRVRARRKQRNADGAKSVRRASVPADRYIERTSWKRPLGIAIASIGLVAGSAWLMTQDPDTLESITTFGGDETASDLDALPVPTAPPTPVIPRETPTPGPGLDLDQFAREPVDVPAQTQVPTVTALPAGAVPIPTRIPALPQLESRPRVPTIPTLISSTPVPTVPAGNAAPSAAPAPAPPPPPRDSPFNQAPAASSAPVPVPQPVALPTPQWQPAPAPPPAPAPAAVAVASGSACTQIAVSYDANLDGVADGSLPSPCSPCPNGSAPAHRNNDHILDC